MRLKRLAFIGTAIVSTALHNPGDARATPARGYKSASIAIGHFREIDLFNDAHWPDPEKGTHGNSFRTSGSGIAGGSKLYVQRNTWQPHGDTGWHSHPGNSLIIVTLGTVTDYDGDDPSCTPHVYTQGMGFVDLGGGDHAHIIRNESNAEAQTIAVQSMPAGAPRRIDRPDPRNCRF
jgi:hypothetical protein